MRMFQLHDYQRTLVDKARQAYADGFKAPCIVAPCGAGKSVMISEIARMTTDKGNRVLFLVHRRELIDQIENTFRLNEVNMDLVQFGMVQTIVRRLDKTPKPSLIITDENHHALASSYRKIYDYFEDVPLLGFTATPIRLNGSGLGDVNDILIEEVDVKWLIENNFLAPYVYRSAKLIDRTHLKLNNLREFSNSSVEAEMKNIIFGDVVKSYRKYADGEQAIAYCHSIEFSKKIEQIFNEEGIVAAHIDAKTPKEIRADLIAKFRSKEIRILCNVDLIGEGFDVPDCSTVIMLRPTQSTSLYVQQSMRGMRYKEGKTSIIIDHVANYLQHGLPSTDRIWSLDGKMKNGNKLEVTIKECPDCYAVYESALNVCPHCGFEREAEHEKEKELLDIELEEITEEDVKITLDFREPEDCNSVEELYQLAKSRGYKPGWAYMQAKRLGML